MTRTQLIEAVKIKLDEYIDGSITHPINDFIDKTLNEAANTLYKEMPIERLPWSAFSIDAAIMNRNSFLTIVSLPDTVLRLGSVKFNSWKRAVTQFYAEGSKEDAMQSDPVTRGTIDRPMVIICKMNDNTNLGITTTYLNIYGGVLNGNITTAGIRVVNSTLPENIPSNLTDPLIYLTAAMVAQIIEREKTAQILTSHYQKYLQ